MPRIILPNEALAILSATGLQPRGTPDVILETRKAEAVKLGERIDSTKYLKPTSQSGYFQSKDGSIRKLANIGLSRPEHNNGRRRRATKAGRR